MGTLRKMGLKILISISHKCQNKVRQLGMYLDTKSLLVDNKQKVICNHGPKKAIQRRILYRIVE